MIEYYILSFGLGFIISMFIFSHIGKTLVNTKQRKIDELIEKNNIFYEVNGKLHKSLREKDYDIQYLKEQLNK